MLVWSRRTRRPMRPYVPAAARGRVHVRSPKDAAERSAALRDADVFVAAPGGDAALAWEARACGCAVVSALPSGSLEPASPGARVRRRPARARGRCRRPPARGRRDSATTSRAAEPRGRRGARIRRRRPSARGGLRRPRPAPPGAPAGAARGPRADPRRSAHAHQPLARLRDRPGGAPRPLHRAGPRRDRDHRPQRGVRRARGGRPREADHGDRRRGGEDLPGRGDRALPAGADRARDERWTTRSRRSRSRAASSTCRTRSTACTRSPTRPRSCVSSTASTSSRSTTRGSCSTAFNDDAMRFAAKYNLIQAAGSDAHVLPGIGTALNQIPAFDGPEEFLLAMRQNQIVRRPEEPAVSSGAEVGSERESVEASGRDRRIRRWVNVAEDQIYERYQAKAIAEINALGHDIAEWLRECPSRRRPGAGHRPSAGRHPASEVRPDGRGGAGGGRLLRPRRPGDPEEPPAACASTRSCCTGRTASRRRWSPPTPISSSAAPGSRARSTSPSRAWWSRWATRPARSSTRSGSRSRCRATAPAGEIQQWTPTIERSTRPTSTECLDRLGLEAAFWAAFKVLGDWYENLPPY